MSGKLLCCCNGSCIETDSSLSRAPFSNAELPDKEKKPRKRKKLAHDLEAWLDGWCAAKEGSNCEVTFVVGFKENDLKSLFQHGDESEAFISMHLIIFGNCRHVKNLKYGQLRGEELLNLATSLVDNKTLSTNMPQKIMEVRDAFLCITVFSLTLT